MEISGLQAWRVTGAPGTVDRARLCKVNARRLSFKIPLVEEPVIYCELREVRYRMLSEMRPDAQVAVPTNSDRYTDSIAMLD